MNGDITNINTKIKHKNLLFDNIIILFENFSKISDDNLNSDIELMLAEIKNLN